MEIGPDSVRNDSEVILELLDIDPELTFDPVLLKGYMLMMCFH